MAAVSRAATTAESTARQAPPEGEVEPDCIRLISALAERGFPPEGREPGARPVEGIAVAAAAEALFAPSVSRRLIDGSTGARSGSRPDGVAPRGVRSPRPDQGLSSGESEQHPHLSRADP